jgi:hypothetical protein
MPCAAAAGAHAVNTSNLLPVSLLGLLIGAVGTGYFLYGRKQQRLIPLLAGILLCVLPMAIDDTLLLLASSAACAAAPFLLRF